MWPKTPSELIRCQRELADLRPPPWRPSSPPLVAGCFVCFARGGSNTGRAGEDGWAGAALMHAGRRLRGTAVVRGEAGAPYEPGMLALREGPLLEATVRALPAEPEVVIANATGCDHPRGGGLALHLLRCPDPARLLPRAPQWLRRARPPDRGEHHGHRCLEVREGGLQ